MASCAWTALSLNASGPSSILLRSDPLNPIYVSVPDPTKTLMRSGADFNDGNYDSGNLVRVTPSGAAFHEPTSAWVLFDSEGPGVITSIWMTGKNKKGQPHLAGRLNFYFDGALEPAWSGLLPELFEDSMIFPKGLAEKSSGGWISYAPIYFQTGLKITLTEHGDSFAHRENARGELIPHIYHQFTYQRLSDAVPSSRPGDPHWTPWKHSRRGSVRPKMLDLAADQWTPLFQADGRGMLESFRVRAADPSFDSAQLRISADGCPQVDMPAREFWGFSRAARPGVEFESLFMGLDSFGMYYCHWPIPHRTNLLLELRPPARLRVELETVHRPGWPEPEHFYFHADPVRDRTEPGRDIQLLQATGRGHYVGAILELTDQALEGDDRFYVDGESFPPSWHGTGTEDYFRCGWYFFGGQLTRPLYGLLDNDRPKIAYRFHVADRVNFTASGRIGFEHGHQNAYIGPYSGVVFWYSENAAPLTPAPTESAAP